MNEPIRRHRATQGTNHSPAALLAGVILRLMDGMRAGQSDDVCSFGVVRGPSSKFLSPPNPICPLGVLGNRRAPVWIPVDAFSAFRIPKPRVVEPLSLGESGPLIRPKTEHHRNGRKGVHERDRCLDRAAQRLQAVVGEPSENTL